MFLIPLIILDWNDTDGLCSITSITRKLRGTPKEDKPHFFNNIINMILKPFNKTVTYEQSSKINYLMFVSWWLYLYWTFLKLQNIKLFDESTDFVSNLNKYTLYLFIIIYVVSLLV